MIILETSKSPKSLILALGLLLSSLLAGCETEPQAVKFNGLVMGTDYSVTVMMSPQQAAQFDPQILQVLQSVDNKMSTYKPTSEVSRFNSIGAGIAFGLSADTAEVISQALTISKMTGGAFDITMAGAVQLWGFGPDGSISSIPSDAQIEGLRASSGFQNITVNAETISKAHADTQIDLSGIAKGFAVDQLSNFLTQQGYQNFLIDVGGELRALGLNEHGQTWRIAIEKPQMIGGVQQLIRLHDAAIATSGDYRNFLTVSGRKFSHTIDPTTLQPILHRIASVSVISAKASTADALATALMAMGETRAWRYSQQNQIAAYFIIREADQSNQSEDIRFEIKYTDKFNDFLQ